MNNIRLTKQFTFEAAHALDGYNGKCRFIHGHSYILNVTVTGKPCPDKSNPKYGMVTDFGDLKAIVQDAIIEKYDHSLVLRYDSVFLTDEIKKHGKLEIVDFQPTCENMLVYFAELLNKKLNTQIKLHSLRLHETATSFAEWFADDQPKET